MDKKKSQKRNSDGSVMRGHFPDEWKKEFAGKSIDTPKNVTDDQGSHSMALIIRSVDAETKKQSDLEMDVVKTNVEFKEMALNVLDHACKQNKVIFINCGYSEDSKKIRYTADMMDRKVANYIDEHGGITFDTLQVWAYSLPCIFYNYLQCFSNKRPVQFARELKDMKI